MKAVLTDERFSDPDWIFERKLDGVRCVAIRDGGPVRLLSRNDLPMNDRYPEIAAALEADPCRRFAIDGEVVAFDGAQTSFAKLHDPAAERFLYVFDITWLDGTDVRERPLRERKRLLGGALRFDGPIRLSRHRNEAGEAMFDEACRKGWEGVIAKRAESPYRTTRSRDWLKFKCEHGQELVVGGWTDPKGSRERFGALLMGYFDATGELRFAGKVGTGFDAALLAEIGDRLDALAADEPPFADHDAIRPLGGRHWVRPELVGEVGFTEWTADGRLRHPRFLGLRDDKPARKVVRES
ncbi:ATP-dependent DNA ligase [Thermoleophilia bacterium SCSIO 60948]|nr:ATP-dependent DNA ligase [Thermoleophilia bacterium SCSIO 60948]